MFGQGFENCAIPDEFDLDNSPIIIKFNFSDGVPGAIEINSLFPSIDGSEFVLTGTGGASGTWTYNPGAGDPAINFFVAKGGPNFNLFDNPGDPNSDTWSTPLNPGGNPANLSHIDFYDTTNGNGVPEPTTLLLLGRACLRLASLAGASNATDGSVLRPLPRAFLFCAVCGCAVM